MGRADASRRCPKRQLILLLNGQRWLAICQARLLFDVTQISTVRFNMPETGFEFYLGSSGNSLTFRCLIGQPVNSVSHVRAFPADFRQSINNPRSIARLIEKSRFTTITCQRLPRRNPLALMNLDSIYTRARCFSTTNRNPLLCIPIEPSKSTDLHCVRTCAN